MDIIQERIPLLIGQAKARAADRKAAETCLKTAEQMLLSSRRSRRTPRWLWITTARQIAETWYSVTNAPDMVERCLNAFVWYKRDTEAWIEMASSLRLALGAKWFDRAWDDRTRKYLVLAEDRAGTCKELCNCASAWHNKSHDHDRSLDCLRRAESMAIISFSAIYEYANTLKCHFSSAGWSKLSEWAAKSSKKAIASEDWLQCAELYQDLDECEMRRCLAKAEENAFMCRDLIFFALKADQLLGANGMDVAMRSLNRALHAFASRGDFRRLLLAAYVVRHRAVHVHEPLCSMDSLGVYDAQYKRCMERFLNMQPTTQEWLMVVSGLRWKEPDETEVDFMLKAESAAASARDWMDCAAGWKSLKLPDAKKNAAICRLRASRNGRVLCLPGDV